MISLAVVSDGNPRSKSTNSGVAKGLLESLISNENFEVVTEISARPAGIGLFLLRLLTFRPSKIKWRLNSNLGVLNLVFRSIGRDRGIRSLDSEVIVMHVRNVYFPTTRAYVAFIDSTSRMAENNWQPWRTSALNRWIRFKIEKLYYQRSLLIFVAGENARASLMKDYGIPSQKVVIVGSGINVKPTLGIQEKSTLGMEILWVGLDWERKGGDIALSAFEDIRRIHPDARLTIVGVDEFEVYENVTFMGRVTCEEELRMVYANADVFILPSRHEPYGIALLEAMAFGLPCVTSSAGNLNHLVQKSGAGLTCSTNNPKEYSKRIIQLLSEPLVMQTMSLNGISYARENASWDLVASNMSHAFKVASTKQRNDL